MSTTSNKVLVIRKPDRTIHVVPLNNEARLKGHSNRLPADKKWKFDVMDEAEAAKLPSIDKDYVTPAKAQDLVKAMSEQLSEKEQQLADLQAKLDALEGGNSNPVKETATAKIERINAATTAEEVTEILGDDSRKTVLDAATAKLASFQQ